MGLPQNTRKALMETEGAFLQRRKNQDPPKSPIPETGDFPGFPEETQNSAR